MAMILRSPAFDDDARIPARHSRDGEDVSPPLEWEAAPDGTRQLALICHDPDAPTVRGFTHWVVYGIPPSETQIPEGGGSRFVEGPNDFGDMGWGGPQPPEGHGTHRYYFWLYALGTEVEPRPGLDREQLLTLMEGQVRDQTRLVGTYSA